MPKTQKIESVFHDWVHGLTFQMQALLMTAMRGPDNCAKENTAKMIIRYFRSAIIKPAGEWNGKNNNSFMWGEYVTEPGYGSLPHMGNYPLFDTYAKDFWDDHDGYPHHFIMHLLHSAQVVGHEHPDENIRIHWYSFYIKGCESFHMREETREEMWQRLNDFGTVEIPDEVFESSKF